MGGSRDMRLGSVVGNMVVVLSTTDCCAETGDCEELEGEGGRGLSIISSLAMKFVMAKEGPMRITT